MQLLKESWKLWLIGGIFMAAMPIGQQPHLFQKLYLLWNGWLKKPEDWFDLALHGVPLLIGIIVSTLVLLDTVKSKKA